MPDQDDKTEREPIHGVFSTMETRKIGTGTTLRKTKVKQHWLVHELDDGLVEVQPINENLIATGKKRTISTDTLLDRFAPEPDFYITSEVPEPATGNGSVLDLDEPSAPEPKAPPVSSGGPQIEGFELSGTPEDVEKSARASFGLALTYLKRGNMTKAVDIFSQLAEAEAPFAPEHKHMFNEFGISLRKERLLDTALKHYLRALDLAPEGDENLHHNIARAYFEKKDIGNAVKFLEQSLKINPDLTESKLFLKYLRRKHESAFGPITL
ncbi:tetratricopeptide repeat protein [Desulfovibrio ferrophilus]|uniref:TPR repeat-containing protein n=1 Tax=Desulfovibrio ferrophilus TaxID=241368 RepID=A0A2Z6AUC9_9BACT|nr:tetratricopeptide repeat protein [Desulfovibrio ferrophilus]BBD06837.1 TPR repeat-containing protein [Desulfovibrio ferrophilus]